MAGRPRDDLEMAQAVVRKMDEDVLADHHQGREIAQELVTFVEDRLRKGIEPLKVARSLGLSGTGDRRWKRILAKIRGGFRSDAEAYIFLQSKRLFRAVEKARDIFEDACENGTPHVIEHEDGGYEVIKVKGATKELASFMKAYSDIIDKPIQMWKTYGAIGEKKEGGGGTTIVVQNNIPMPTLQAIEAHQKEILAKAEAIECSSKTISTT